VNFVTCIKWHDEAPFFINLKLRIENLHATEKESLSKMPVIGKATRSVLCGIPIRKKRKSRIMHFSEVQYFELSSVNSCIFNSCRFDLHGVPRLLVASRNQLLELASDWGHFSLQELPLRDVPDDVEIVSLCGYVQCRRPVIAVAFMREPTVTPVVEMGSNAALESTAVNLKARQFLGSANMTSAFKRPSRLQARHSSSSGSSATRQTDTSGGFEDRAIYQMNIYCHSSQSSSVESDGLEYVARARPQLVSLEFAPLLMTVKDLYYRNSMEKMLAITGSDGYIHFFLQKRRWNGKFPSRGSLAESYDSGRSSGGNSKGYRGGLHARIPSKHSTSQGSSQTSFPASIESGSVEDSNVDDLEDGSVANEKVLLSDSSSSMQFDESTAGEGENSGEDDDEIEVEDEDEDEDDDDEDEDVNIDDNEEHDEEETSDRYCKEGSIPEGSQDDIDIEFDPDVPVSFSQSGFDDGVDVGEDDLENENDEDFDDVPDPSVEVFQNVSTNRSPMQAFHGFDSAILCINSNHLIHVAGFEDGTVCCIANSTSFTDAIPSEKAVKKFHGPISCLEILPVSNAAPSLDVLVCGSAGFAAILEVSMNDGEVSIDETAKILPDSNEHDSVTCSKISDIDWDGQDEIMLGTYGKCLLVFRKTDGTYLKLWERKFAYPIFAIETGDFNQDGLDEIVVITLRGVHILQPDLKVATDHVLQKFNPKKTS